MPARFAELFAAFVRTKYTYRRNGVSEELRPGDPATGPTHEPSRTFLTAWNPQAEPLDLVENRRRQAALERELTARGIDFVPATATADDGSWPPEEGSVAFGLPADEALALACRYGQLAILHAPPGEPALLLFVDESSISNGLAELAAGPDDRLGTAASHTLAALVDRKRPEPPPAS